MLIFVSIICVDLLTHLAENRNFLSYFFMFSALDGGLAFYFIYFVKIRGLWELFCLLILLFSRDVQPDPPANPLVQYCLSEPEN